MTQQAIVSSNVTTPGKPSAMGPPSDAGPSAPPQKTGDARARAIDAAREAKRNANGQFAKEAPEAAAPATEAAPDSNHEAAEVSGEAAATPPAAAEESPLDYRTRVRQREQRKERELEQRQAALTQREQEIAAREAQSRQVLDRHAQLEQLKKTDVAKWAQEIGLDETTLKPIVMSRIAAGKPEGQVLTLEQKIAAMEQREREREDAWRQQAANASRAQSEQAFVKLVSDGAKYPAVAAFYSDDPSDLVREAYSIQQRFQAQFRRVPSQEEIALNLERMVKDRASRAAKVLGPEKAKPTSVEAPKPKPPSPSDQARTSPPQQERAETDRERKERAARAAKAAQAAANKRNVAK